MVDEDLRLRTAADLYQSLSVTPVELRHSTHDEVMSRLAKFIALAYTAPATGPPDSSALTPEDVRREAERWNEDPQIEKGRPEVEKHRCSVGAGHPTTLMCADEWDAHEYALAATDQTPAGKSLYRKLKAAYLAGRRSGRLHHGATAGRDHIRSDGVTDAQCAENHGETNKGPEAAAGNLRVAFLAGCWRGRTVP